MDYFQVDSIEINDKKSRRYNSTNLTAGWLQSYWYPRRCYHARRDGNLLARRPAKRRLLDLRSVLSWRNLVPT